MGAFFTPPRDCVVALPASHPIGLGSRIQSSAGEEKLRGGDRGSYRGVITAVTSATWGVRPDHTAIPTRGGRLHPRCAGAIESPYSDQSYGCGLHRVSPRSRWTMPLVRLGSGSCGPAASGLAPVRLEGGDVRCLQTLWARRDLEFNRLTFVERSVPLRLDG